MTADLNRVRQYRKSVSLAQREAAALVGLEVQNSFSELESGAKRPGLDVAIACALALDVPVNELFPTLAAHVEQDLLARARRLHAELVADPLRQSTAVYLAALIKRLVHLTQA